MKSASYQLGYNLVMEKSALGNPLRGLQAILRRFGRQFAVGAGRKAQEIGQRTKPLESILNEAKHRVGGQRYISPTEKLYRRPSFGRSLGSTFAEHPVLTTATGGLTLSQLNDMITNAGQGSAIRDLQER